MTDRGILFSAPMVRGLLREARCPGTGKTQTRRMLSLRGFRKFSEFGPSDTPGYDWHFRREDACWCDFRATELPLRWQVGDRLWVKETWQVAGLYTDVAEIRYRASQHSGHTEFVEQIPIEQVTRRLVDFPKWRPSLLMYRWASRLTLTVTDVRVERLQDISEADAIAEGIDEVTREVAPRDPSLRHWKRYRDGGWNGYVDSPIGSYASLWTEINGPGAWEANPWVVAISFTVQRGNIDQVTT